MPVYDRDKDPGNLLKVKLREQGRVGDKRRTVVFDVTPDLSEEGSVSYNPIQITHAPGEMYIFDHTKSRNFNLNTQLISRTREEATRNLARLNLLRSWKYPVFGSTGQVTNNLERLSEDLGHEQMDAIREDVENDYQVLGAPPAVLQLSAYSDASHRGHLHRVRTVLTNMSVNYPSDVDYIPTGPVRGFEEFASDVPMPTVMTVDLTLAETHAPDEYARFNLAQYRLGVLGGF